MGPVTHPKGTLSFFFPYSSYASFDARKYKFFGPCEQPYRRLVGIMIGADCIVIFMDIPFLSIHIYTNSWQKYAVLLFQLCKVL